MGDCRYFNVTSLVWIRLMVPAFVSLGRASFILFSDMYRFLFCCCISMIIRTVGMVPMRHDPHSQSQKCSTDKLLPVDPSRSKSETFFKSRRCSWDRNELILDFFFFVLYFAADSKLWLVCGRQKVLDSVEINIMRKSKLPVMLHTYNSFMSSILPSSSTTYRPLWVFH